MGGGANFVAMFFHLIHKRDHGGLNEYSCSSSSDKQPDLGTIHDRIC